MRHTLRLHGVIVGHSELEHIEPGTGRAWGAFRPGLGYELVQPVFRLFAHAVPRDGSARDETVLARYYKARDALQLELQDANGAPIPTSAIHIADYSVEEGASAIELDVLIADESYWERRGAR
ncbi:MAG TPA: hypothetical protein VN706_25140 [Gemmatimonadaceae bacterium]|nr:hypothetical protein [Gemmatimonadaceae bacterium]